MNFRTRLAISIVIVSAAACLIGLKSQETPKPDGVSPDSAAAAQKASMESPSLEQREAKLQGLVGMNVYACWGARFLEFRESKDPGSIPPGYKVLWESVTLPTTTLSPLPIKKVFAFGGIAEARNVYVIVELGGGKEGIMFGHMRTSGPLLSGEKLLAELIGTERESNILTKIPEAFSQESIESIRFHQHSRGMTWSELDCSIGRAESVNTYGDEKQLIYNGGRLIIYLDSSGRVADVQEFDR